MGRAWTAVDRGVLLLVGLVVTVLGVALATWGQELWPRTAEQLDLQALRDAPSRPMWPWAVGFAGLAAVLLGGWSLAGHLTRHRVRRVTLAAGGGPGLLRVDLKAMADAATERLRQSSEVTAASARVVVDRRSRVLELVVWCDPSADLDAVRRAVDRVVEQLGVMLPDGIVAVRVLLESRGASVREPRVL